MDASIKWGGLTPSGAQDCAADDGFVGADIVVDVATGCRAITAVAEFAEVGLKPSVTATVAITVGYGGATRHTTTIFFTTSDDVIEPAPGAAPVGAAVQSSCLAHRRDGLA